LVERHRESRTSSGDGWNRVSTPLPDRLRGGRVVAVMSSAGRGSEGLSVLHERLETHFGSLRTHRDERGHGAPIFALEHGLSEAELALLNAEVQLAVRRGQLPEKSWLPFVIYAAEIGYEYSGDEYWQTFEEQTPHWAENGDRHYIRRKFHKFKDQFRGAEPTGPWALHFSIICWPITHAVLPADLQRHLAHLLFEYRRALTSDLLDDPAELGRRLAARSWQTSSRFQNFAQNTNLLGQVAVALLVGDETDSPYLLSSTLRRIVADLSKEREAWRLLRGAKSSATQVRIRGVRPVDGDTHDRAGSGTAPRLPSAADPELSLRNEGVWTAYLEVPDLSVLAERLPMVHQEAAQLRALVQGVAGPPLARGQLLYPGRQLKLSKWPHPGAPLIQLENGSNAVNSLLSDQCVLSPGPVWLFRLRETREAGEVRGKFVRPGHKYVILSEEALSEGLPAWITTTASATAGICTYIADTPTVLGSDDLASLRSAGLATVTDVEIRPAGLVPALWDGEGAAEWIAGEHPIVAVSSSRAVSGCILTLDSDPHLVDWPAGGQEIFLRLADLGVGSHRLHFSLLLAERDQPAAEGTFDLIIRPPAARPSTGSFREGLMVLATPVNPTLTEIWNGRASLDIRGPAGARVTIEMALADGSHGVLARQRLRDTLPIDASQWAGLASQFRGTAAFRRFYDEAESTLISVSHPGLGMVTLRCEREFSPLRWVAGQDGDEPYVRLLNNTGSANASVEILEFAYPDRPVQVEIDARQRVHWPTGGLVTARAGTVLASIVLSPRIHNIPDLKCLNVRRFSSGSRSFDDVRRLIDLAHRWAAATLPANPVALTGRIHVERAITSHVAGLIGGGRWKSLEQRAARDSDSLRTSELEAALGVEQYQRALARTLLREIDGMLRLRPERRAGPLAGILATHARRAGVRRVDSSLAEFLLRLASEPASLTIAPQQELKSRLNTVLKSPVLLRAARFLVLAIDAIESEDSGSTHRGWAWE
jgi:hypothetical protein